MKKTEPDYYTKTSLRDLRKWSFTLVDKFTGEPCKRRGNPYNKKHLICLYGKERILAIEQTAEFKKAWKLMLKRKKASKHLKNKKPKTKKPFMFRFNDRPLSPEVKKMLDKLMEKF